jgi:hypothetical protein
VSENKDFKNASAEILGDLLRSERVRRGVDYLRGDEFKSERDRLRQEAAERIKRIRDRARGKRRTPEEAARERELTLRLAEVEAESAELRVRLAELLEEEAAIRGALEEL